MSMFTEQAHRPQRKHFGLLSLLSLMATFNATQPALSDEFDVSIFDVLGHEFKLKLPVGYCNVPSAHPFSVSRFQELDATKNQAQAIFVRCDALARQSSGDGLMQEAISMSHGWITSFPEIDTNGQEALNNSILRSLGDNRKIEEFRNIGSTRGLNISFSEHTVFRLDSQVLIVSIPVRTIDPKFGESSRLIFAAGINRSHRTTFVYLSLNLENYSIPEVVEILNDFSVSIQNFE